MYNNCTITVKYIYTYSYNPVKFACTYLLFSRLNCMAYGLLI